MTDDIAPLTDTEKAYFNTIKQVTRSSRPEDLSLRRMTLDGEPVAVIMQRVISSDSAQTVGFQPLALLVDDEIAAALRDHTGEAPTAVDASDVEGAA
jgi:sensor domain CHASE-containing protein